MEQYYDSDEEIAWGPPTLKEIKDNLLKTKRNIQSRMSTCGRLETKFDVSESSQYFTANNSTESDNVPNFNSLYSEDSPEEQIETMSEKLENTFIQTNENSWDSISDSSVEPEGKIINGLQGEHIVYVAEDLNESNDSIEVPQIDIEQFNDSDSFTFNDTYDEILAAIKTYRQAKTDHSPKKNLTPVKDPEPEFKVPLSARKTPKAKTPKYKDIVSPVALYIKNSPAIYKKENVCTLSKTRTPLKPINRPIRRKVFYPEVIYKPAKNKVEVEEMGQRIPASLQKYMPATACIKHQRQGQKLPLSIVQKRLEEGDLTTVDFDDTVSGHDVSVRITKTALRY